MSAEKPESRKEPRARNRYTGRRAQNLAWVREYLMAGLKGKQERGHVLNRESLIACKYLLLMEGVKVNDRLGAERNAGCAPKDRAAKSVIRMPKLAETLQ